MCCDFLIASERARFADTHVRVGVMPGGGMTIRLPQLIGIDRARRMSFTGDYIDAATARDWGLVVEVVPHESLLAAGPRAGGHHRGHPRRVRPRAPARVRRDRRTDRAGGCSPRPPGRGSGWRSASTSRACPPSARRSSPGAGRRPRGTTARRREGLRGHGPAARASPTPSPTPSGSSGSATTGCTWPRRCTTRWPWRCWSPSTRSGSPSAPASPSPSPAAPPSSPTRPGTSPS